MVWRVKGSSPVEVTAKQAGQFYSGNVYVVHHGYKENGAQKDFIFVWQVCCHLAFGGPCLRFF